MADQEGMEMTNGKAIKKALTQNSAAESHRFRYRPQKVQRVVRWVTQEQIEQLLKRSDAD